MCEFTTEFIYESQVNSRAGAHVPPLGRTESLSDDQDHGPPDPYDDDDFASDFSVDDAYVPRPAIGPSAQAQATGCTLDPLAQFIKELKDVGSMSGPDISSIIADLPVPEEIEFEGMSLQDAVKVLWIQLFCIELHEFTCEFIL